VASGSEPVDARADRAIQGTITVITLGAFVFHQAWLIPVLAVFLAAGALIGPAGNPLLRLFSGLIAPRLSPVTGVEPASTVHAQDVLAVAILGLAAVCLLIGLGGLAWIITLIEGGVAAVAATTGTHLGVVARDRLRRH
jgi:Domain of unknown function (DUF4395)